MPFGFTVLSLPGWNTFLTDRKFVKNQPNKKTKLLSAFDNNDVNSLNQ